MRFRVNEGKIAYLDQVHRPLTFDVGRISPKIESVNPILTGLFETKFLLGGGGQFDPPLQISAPKGPIAAKFGMDVKTHLKSIATKKKIAENGLYIILL